MTGEDSPVATPQDVRPATDGTTTGAARSRAGRFARTVGWGAVAGLVAGASVGTVVLPVVGTFYGALFGIATGLGLGAVEAVALALLPCTDAARPVVRGVGTVVAAVSGGLYAEHVVGGTGPRDGVTVVLFAVVCAVAGFGVADAAGYRLTALQTAGWRLVCTTLLVALGALSLVQIAIIQTGSGLPPATPAVAGLLVGTVWAVVGAVRLRRAATVVGAPVRTGAAP